MNLISKSCFTCKFRKLPLKDNQCVKGVTDKNGIVINCLGWKDRSSKKGGAE